MPKTSWLGLETIVALAENTERLMHLFEAQRLKASGG